MRASPTSGLHGGQGDRKDWLAKALSVVTIRRAGGKPVPVAERMAVGLTDGSRLHEKAGRSSEPFGIPKGFLALRIKRDKSA